MEMALADCMKGLTALGSPGMHAELPIMKWKRCTLTSKQGAHPDG